MERKDHIWITPLWKEYESIMEVAERSEYTRVIDLSASDEVLLKNMTRGHRTAIKQSQKIGVETILNPDFNLFLEHHRVTEGRKKRNPRCWQIMRELIDRGEAFLMGARYKGEWIAFSYFFVYGNWAYYGAGNIKEKYKYLKPSHIIQWEAMRQMKARGINEYEIGDQYPNGAPDEKVEAIAKFKRGFGGSTKKAFEIWKQENYG